MVTTAMKLKKKKRKKYLLLGGKLMTHLDTLFKIKDIVLPKKVHAYKAIVFLVFFIIAIVF